MKTKRILSLLLSLIMLFGLTVTPSFAETKEENNAETLNITQHEENYPDSSVTIPDDATLFVGTKGEKHFVSFSEIQPAFTVPDDTNTKYYFELDNGKTYNYRVSGDDYVTYGGTFEKTENFNLSVTKEQLMPEGKSKSTLDTNPLSNNEHNVADIFLNINPEGHLRLSPNDSFQVIALRNWEAVNNTSSNYFIEPDFHYEAIDENGNASDVVEIDKNGLLTAKKNGTAIVLVTYDSMTLSFGESDFYGALWPENTGVFVVTVNNEENTFKSPVTINKGKNSAEIKLSGDSIDSEHDCIYFTGDETTFTFVAEEENIKISVANPTIDKKTTYNGFKEITKADDKTFPVPLKAGRNIIKFEKDGKYAYQVITAKKVNITVNNGDSVHPGDSLKIEFDKLYHPANKLAGVYNMSASAIYTNVSGYEGKIIGAASAQYNFASNKDSQTISDILKEKDMWGCISYEKDTELIIPEDYAYDTFVLREGTIYVSGWGDSYGNHRAITYENGKGANLNADAKIGYFGKLPDIEIPVTVTDAKLDSITLDTENVNKEYYTGDKFDTKGLIVTAIYADESTQTATNYTVSPEILSADTKKVTIEYKGLTHDIPVNVTNPKVTSLEITSPPEKTEYTEGEAFNPSGIVITAVYENGIKKETTDYSYSPNRELELTDTEMLFSYIGENGIENVKAVSQPITVKKKSSGSSSSSSGNTITVYFTLMGDEKHGTPENSSDTHTRRKGNLDTWVSKTKITLNKNSYVIDAVKKALSLNGIPYTFQGNYISSIKGLSEFDNGNLSGWMYTLNGKYPSLGINEQKLSASDAIVFHYTDDYTAEKKTYSSSSSSSGRKPAKTEEKKSEEETKPLKAEFSEKTYSDIKPADWHYEAVKYVHEKGLMQGSGKGFEPESKMTRAMIITVLWRMEKEPVTDYALSFEDVKADDWYTDAVKWAASENIISGIGDNKFGTDNEVTREQLATILYRYMQKKEPEKISSADILSYADTESISEYALPALKWAVNSKIINGKSENLLCPSDFSTRAEVATMLMRFCERNSQ